LGVKHATQTSKPNNSDYDVSATVWNEAHTIEAGTIVNTDVNASAAIASSKLAAGKIPIFVPYNGKIADIAPGDTNPHYLDLAAALSETRTIISITPKTTRVSGTGSMYLYPNEGTTVMNCGSGHQPAVIIASGTQRLKYALTVATDDWDLYCLGYVVEA